MHDVIVTVVSEQDLHGRLLDKGRLISLIF